MNHVHRSTSTNESPVAQLYQLHAPSILIYLRRHLATKEDAEDLLLEVFVAAVENHMLPDMELERQRAWLQQVAHNKLVDYYRRQTRRPIVTLNEFTETLFDDETMAPEQVVLRREEQARLRERLATLPELQQQVLWLRFAYGLSTREIAQRLNRSDVAIRMVFSRAMNFLRVAYGQVKEDEHE